MAVSKHSGFADATKPASKTTRTQNVESFALNRYFVVISNVSDPDIIGAEIDTETPVSSPSGLPVHVACSNIPIFEDLQCARKFVFVRAS